MDLVFEFSHTFSPEFCNKIIDKFNSETRVKKYDTQDCVDISYMSGWEEIIEEFEKKVPDFKDMYRKHWMTKWPDVNFEYPMLIKEPLFIRKLNSGDIWESPHYAKGRFQRFVAFYIYLSDEGETDFIHKKVKAKTGKLVMFPATWHDIYSHANCKGLHMLTGFFHRPLTSFD